MDKVVTDIFREGLCSGRVGWNSTFSATGIRRDKKDFIFDGNRILRVAYLFHKRPFTGLYLPIAPACHIKV